MRRFSLLSSILFLLCSSCAQATKPTPISSPVSDKLTETSGFSELMVGSLEDWTKVKENLLSDLPRCFSKPLENRMSFRAHVKGEKIVVEEGSLEQVSEIKACLHQFKISSQWKALWIWTPDLTVPAIIKKNFRSFPYRRTSVPTYFEKGAR